MQQGQVGGCCGGSVWSVGHSTCSPGPLRALNGGKPCRRCHSDAPSPSPSSMGAWAVSHREPAWGIAATGLPRPRTPHQQGGAVMPSASYHRRSLRSAWRV